jgi:ATP-dependent Clp protease ATP-binding subunit ClpX
MIKNPIKCAFCKKNRSESLKMVVSGDYSICDKCIILFNGLLKSTSVAETTASIQNQEKKQLAEQLNSIKIREFMDQYVIGQESAKMALCVSVVNHYKRMLYEYDGEDISKSNLMITGPSGSGKSLLVSTVAKFLDVPFLSVDATTLTEAGYIGQNVDTIITRLLIEANGDIVAAENGIVFLDEIDKITTKNRVSGTETRISGIQSALLKMVEGTIVPVNLNTDLRRGSKIVEINTENILFICGGAFNNMNDIVAERLKKKKGLGFSEHTIIKTANIESEYITEDFIEFGMIPEFVGRFPIKTFTKELTEQELFQVLTNTKNNILNEYKFYFSVDNIDLEFTQDFIEQIAHQTKIEKIGVRGLRSICDALMLPHLYLLPEYQKRNVAKITFYGDCINKKQLPKIEIFEKKNVAKKIKM